MERILTEAYASTLLVYYIRFKLRCTYGLIKPLFLGRLMHGQLSSNGWFDKTIVPGQAHAWADIQQSNGRSID